VAVQGRVIKVMQGKIAESVICFNESALIYHQFDYIPITEKGSMFIQEKTIMTVVGMCYFIKKITSV